MVYRSFRCAGIMAAESILICPLHQKYQREDQCLIQTEYNAWRLRYHAQLGRHAPVRGVPYLPNPKQ